MTWITRSPPVTYLTEDQRRTYRIFDDTFSDTDSEPTQENSMAHTLDQELLNRLDSARQARNRAAEYAERLYDEAYQYDQLAILKRSLGKRVIDELNEDMPVPSDS